MEGKTVTVSSKACLSADQFLQLNQKTNSLIGCVLRCYGTGNEIVEELFAWKLILGSASSWLEAGTQERPATRNMLYCESLSF